MKFGALMIVAGYLVLVVSFGWVEASANLLPALATSSIVAVLPGV